MSDRPIYTVARGVPYRMLLASDADSIDDYGCTADVRRLPGGRNSYTPAEDVAASYLIEAFAGDETLGPGCYLTLSGEQTADMEPGIYASDARITSTETTVTGQWLLDVQEAITQ